MANDTRPPFDTLVFDVSYALGRSPYRVKPSRLGADEHYRLVAKAVVDHLRVCGWRVERDDAGLAGPNGFVGGRTEDVTGMSCTAPDDDPSTSLFDDKTGREK